MDKSCMLLSVGAILTAPLFFVLGLRAKGPKLVSAGGVGEVGLRVPGKDIIVSMIAIQNVPTVWGIKVSREPAKVKFARVYDPGLEQNVGVALRWKGGGTELPQAVTIEAGSQETVYLFAKERGTPEYFVYNANALDSELLGPVVTYQDRMKAFSVVLEDHLGRRYRIKVKVRNPDGDHLTVILRKTLSERVLHLRDGLSSFRAVLPSRN